MRRTLLTAAAGGLLAASVATMAPVGAAPAQTDVGQALPVVGPYAGFGTSELVGVEANLAGTSVVDVDLTPAEVAVDSTAEPRSTGRVANLDADLLGELSLSGILSEATQSAPPDNADPVQAELLDVPAAPLLGLTVSTAETHARWPGDSACFAPGAPIVQSVVTTADANVLEVPGLGNLVSVVNDAGGAGTTRSVVTTETVDGQEGRALQSRSETQVSSVILFQGTPAEIEVQVAATPSLTATATGAPGGATAVLDVPAVNIVTGDETIPDLPLVNLVPLDQLGGLIDQLTDALEDVVNQTVENAGLVSLDVLIGEETLNVEAAGNGTSVTAAGAAAIVRVSVLDVLGDPLLDATVSVAPMSAAAAVPEGGLRCDPPVPPIDNPLRDLHKDASQAQVEAGSSFDYTLTVPNRGPCDLTQVVVTDTITGPAGSTFTAVPAPSSTSGNTLTWDVGTLAANETLTFTITVDVPAGAANGDRYVDDLRATGVCDGEPVENAVQLPTPTVDTRFNGDCDLSLSNKSASHLEVTPGQTFNYFVHVFNRGGTPCNGIDVTDTLDDRLAFVSCTDGCTNSGQTVTWTGQSVDAGGGITLTVTVQVRDGSSGRLANTADIDSPDDEGGPVTVTHNGPQITDQSVPAPPNPPSLIPQDVVVVDLPRTGGDAQLALVAALALAGLAAVQIRRRLLI